MSKDGTDRTKTERYSSLEIEVIHIMEDSILNSVKKALGIDSEFTAFDESLIMHINSVFFIMAQMGIGKNFIIEDSGSTWSDYLDARSDLEAVKTYMYAKVRQIFDPPTGGVADALDRTVKELEWRLFSATDLIDTKLEDIKPFDYDY